MNLPVTQSVQVVIVTFNRAEFLRKCLQALASQTQPISRITVVNNCSTDHTSDVLQELQAAGMPVVEHRTQRNLGGAGGFAVAFGLAKKIKADWVWVMDDDVEAAPDCLESLLLASEGAAVVQPNRYQNDYQFLETYQRVNMSNPVASMFQKKIRLGPQDRAVNVDIGFFPFEGPLIRQSVLNALDLPRAEYFLFCDDVEYSIRVTNSGGRIRLCGAAWMRRLIPAVTEVQFTWRNYFDFRNRIWMDKTHSGFVFALTRGLLWMFWQGFSCLRHRRDAVSYRVVWRGTWDGLFGREKKFDDIVREFAR